LLLFVLAVSALAACGDDDTTTSTGDAGEEGSSAEGGTGEAGAYPVTIEHLWGSTTVESEPDRIVTLGVTDADVVLALGKTPIALTGFAFFETGLGPWAQPLVEGDQPQLLKGEPNLELIASLRPDLIIGVSAGFEEPVYEQLAKIAPTLVRPAGTAAYQVPRTDATEMIAAALGQPERGEALAAETDDLFDEAVADHPEFAGKTAAVVLPYDGKYGVYTPRDARGQVMTQLGFELPPALAALDTENKFFIEISQEQVGLLDADVLVMLADAPQTRTFVDNDQILQGLPVVEDGRMIILDTATRGSITYNTVISVPYTMEHLLPQLEEALAG
jgi:iron complex transport system substrate-binding protein